jgi:acyl carrier protein
MTVEAYLPGVTAALRAASRIPLPEQLRGQESLVFDLGFDSLAITRLGLALEEQFGCAILLDGWISSESDPQALTVASLCGFLASRLETDERSVA